MVGQVDAVPVSLMPITPYLHGFDCDAETKRVMGVAFEMARVSLGISSPTDGVNETIARCIIELAKSGERNPDLLCESVLAQLRQQSSYDAGSTPDPRSSDPQLR
jgi:hypothetical protein